MSCVHPAYSDEFADELMVCNAAEAMRTKLSQARAKGRGGWHRPDECSIEHLWELLRGHIEKGDPVDIMNLAGMIHSRQLAEREEEKARRERWRAITGATLGDGQERIDLLTGVMSPPKEREEGE